MPNDVVIREARPGDIAGVLALWDAARSDHARTADALEHLLVDRPGALLVADEDGAVMGAVIATWDGWRGNMYRLAVRPSRRRRGIALGLVREGEKRLRE